MTSRRSREATIDCLQMMAEAKSTLVKIDGIGSELLPAIAAWQDDEPIGYAIVQNPFATGPLTLTNLTIAARLMVSGWHADALAVVMEGYVEDANPFVDSNHKALAERFPTDNRIREALWVAYTNVKGDACMGITCFSQELGRTVKFDDPELSSDDQLDDFSEEGTIPHMLTKALKEVSPTPIPKHFTIDQCRKRMAQEIHLLGFSVYLHGSEDSWVTFYSDEGDGLPWVPPDYPDLG